jgi:hypothetical protein
MRYQTLSIAILGALAALGITAAGAQELPQYRDSRTGKVWTPVVPDPEEASMSDYSGVNRAFDPNDQRGRVPGVVVQHPRANLMGTVPITAGPTVPVMVIDTPSLQVIPARHWVAIVYVTNNSASTIDSVVSCHFTNQGRTVESTRIVVPPAGPGERLGMAVRGPRFDVYVDQVACQLLSPA